MVCGGDDGYIYYRSESTGDNFWTLCRAKPDGSEKKKLSGCGPENINVLNGWVYFLDYKDNFSIKKVRTDGTGETKLIEGYCSNLYVAESGLYFDKRDESNTPQTYRAGLDGSNLTKLVPDAAVAYYYKNKLYFSDVTKLGVYDIASGEGKILKQTYVHNVSVDDSGIYYWAVDEGEYRRMDLDGGNEEPIYKGGDYFNYCDGNLYFMGISENLKGLCHVINRYNIQNNETITLLEESNEFFNAQGIG